VLGFSPLETGVRVLPITLLAFVVAPLAGKLTTVVPVRAIMGIGLACCGLGLALMHGVTAHSDWTALLAGFLFVGAGIGAVNPSLVSTAVGVVSTARSGMASGINNTFRQLGVATGIAAFGAIFQARVESRLSELTAHTPAAHEAVTPEAVRQVSTGQAEQVWTPVPTGAQKAIAGALPDSFVSGLNSVFVVASVLAFAGAILAVVLIRGRDFTDEEEPVPEAAVPAAG
jgi:hypothetical protein